MENPANIVLRPYQETAISSGVNWVKYMSGKNGIIWAATAAGKSILIARIAEAFPDKRVLILAHRKELLEQNVAKFATDTDVSIFSAGLGKKDLTGRVVMAGIQSIANMSADLLPNFDLILIDECFVGDTLVSTPSGLKRIDELCKGDTVFNACGIGTVCDIYKSNAEQTIKIGLSNGKHIECTPNHPFFTERGWEKAKDLVVGRKTYSNKAMRTLWNRFSTVTNRKQENFCQAQILFNILRKESGKPDEQKCSAFENERYLKKNKTQANKKGWEWATSNFATVSFASRAGRRLERRGCSKNKCWTLEWCLSKLLQIRHCQRSVKNWLGNRWQHSLWDAKSKRREEERLLGDVRVESISYSERKSLTPVFNLHVSGHPSYFANGVLVHNCHRLSNNAEDDSQYWNIINKVGSPQVLGFTATPYRLSGGFLSWGEIIYEIKYPELLDLKFVTPLSNKATATPDLSKVKVKLGEYVESQLEEIMLDPALLQAAIESLLVYSNDRNSVLIFAISKKHCELLCEAMKESGIAGGVGFITGDTTDSERARLLEMFKAGELRYLINCMVLIEGFDAPCIDMIMCLRPTMSKTLWEQMLGRGVRLFSGKDNCLVVDMAGNLVKHGSLAAPYVAPKMGEPPKGDAGRVCPECEEFNEGTNITECESCGYEFPPPEGRTHSHNYEPDIDSPTIYRAVQRYEVESVSYRKHVKTANGNISLRVDYVCHGAPYGSFSEWISFMHETETTAQWMQNKAWKFFKDRGVGLPDEIQKLSMDTLLALTEQLRQPVAILVDTSQKFSTIKEYIWSEADETEDRESNSSRCSELVQEVYDLDDIPF